MQGIYKINGLVHWTEREIRLRERFITEFEYDVRAFLLGTNPAWNISRVEGPLLTPLGLISAAYTPSDVFVQETFENETPLVLRPETTPATYAWMCHLIEQQEARFPMCVWQAGKSFRREQDQVSKNMRLKEFYQMEFQCAFTADSANDYHGASLEPVRRMLESAICLPTRLVESDRLPAYSQITMDVEVDNGDKWMEVCSISRRTDFPMKARFANKKGEVVEKELLILEIAIGLDRCVYNRLIRESRIQ